jgi:hypothetical protein
MSLRVLFIVAACLLAPGALAAQDADPEEYENDPQFPYQAYINSDDVYVRSGPGQNYYPVLRLNRGETVDVYRHDPGGWNAIRPPAKCFSWVSADFVAPGEGKMATIKGERVVARVGSDFSDIRDVIQVRLNKGEPIEVLEAKRIGTGPAAQTWYKIAPPAGEFRWVSGKFIDRELPEREARRRDPNNNLLIARHSRRHQAADDDYAGRTPESIDGRAEDQSWREDESARQARLRRADDDERPQAREEDDERPPEAYRRVPRSHASREADARLLAELEQIDLDLSATVSRDIATWDLRALRDRTNSLLAHSDTALDRGRVRLVQRKIARFEDIKKRHDSIAAAQLATDVRNRDVMQASLGGSMGVRTDLARYDGIGRLTQIYPAQAGVASFALVDKEGRVTHYVTAAPGVNLRPYLGQDVGIQGTLGYMPDARTPHVTAKRVSLAADSTSVLR